MQFNQIKETCLYVKDLTQTSAFYKGKLGLEQFSYVEGSHVFFKAGSSVLLCFLNEKTKEQGTLPPHYGEGKLHFAFEIDPEAYVACKQELIGLGIAVEHEEGWEGGFKSFYFRDPDGHLAEVVEKGMWEV